MSGVVFDLIAFPFAAFVIWLAYKAVDKQNKHK